jgi:hypothetical protein
MIVLVSMHSKSCLLRCVCHICVYMNIIVHVSTWLIHKGRARVHAYIHIHIQSCMYTGTWIHTFHVYTIANSAGIEFDRVASSLAATAVALLSIVTASSHTRTASLYDCWCVSSRLVLRADLDAVVFFLVSRVVCAASSQFRARAPACAQAYLCMCMYMDIYVMKHIFVRVLCIFTQVYKH